MNNYSRFKLMIMLMAVIITGINATDTFAVIRTITVGSASYIDNNWPATNQPSAVSSAIYTRADLGNLANAVISKIGLYVTSTNNPNANSIDNVYILLRNTTATSAELPVIPCGISGINALVANGFQIVRGPFTLRGSQLIVGWNDINFTTPFSYTGSSGSNLQVVIATVEQKNTLQGTVNNFNVYTYYSTTGLTRPSAFYSPNNYCQAIMMPGQTQNVRPYIRFEVEDAASPGQQYVSSNCSQTLVTVAESGDENVPILRVEINIHNNVATFNNLTAMVFNGKNSHNLVETAKLYYSGTNPVFDVDDAGTTSIANLTLNEGNVSNINFSGLNVSLSHGTNYFWLVYDMTSGGISGAGEGNVDASLTSFNTSRNGTVTNTTNRDPAGEVYVRPRNSPPITLNETNDMISGEVFIGEPYSNSVTYNGYVASNYPQAYVESLYKSYEIGESRTLYNIAWEIATTNTTTNYLYGISVWLKESDTSYLSTPGTYPDTLNGGYTKVLENATIQALPCSVGSWLVFNFDTPFEYSGGNLQVLITKRTTTLPSSFTIATSHSYHSNPYRDNTGTIRYATKYGYVSTTTGTVAHQTTYNYRPNICFNKYENNKLCTRSGIVYYDGKVNNSGVIRSYQPLPYTYAAYTSTSSYGYLGYYPKTFINMIFPASNMGNYALGNCPRTITGLSLMQANRQLESGYTSPNFTDSIGTTEAVIKIWLRNNPTEVNFNTNTNTNPYNFYNTEVLLEQNGFVKCFEGSFTNRAGFCRIHFPFNENNFEYDGTSSVEVFIFGHHPTYGGYTYHRIPGSSTNYGNQVTFTYYYSSSSAAPDYNTSAINYRYAQSTTSGEAALLNMTSWTNGTYGYRMCVDWDYIPASQILQDISTDNMLQTQVSTKEYALFRVDIFNNEQSCNPFTLNGFKVRLNNSEGVEISKINVYNVDPVTTYNAVPLATVYYPEGDLVRVTFPTVTLSPANNTYWISAEVSEDTDCSSLISGSLYSAIISDKDFDSRYFSAVVPTNIPLDYGQFRFMPRGLDDKICIDKVDSVYTVDVMGSVGGYQWYLWNRDISNFEAVPGATSNYLNIYRDNVINGNNIAKLVATPPPGECSEPDSLTLNFSVSLPASDAYTTLNGYPTSTTDTLVTCYEEETILVGHYSGDVYRFQWQYLDAYNQWQNISMADVLTATQDTMYFTPSARFRNTMLRFVAYSDPACDGYVASTPFPVQSYAKNYFDIQPPKTVNLCRGERLYVSAIYVGEPAISARWYKDGFPLEYNVDPILDIGSVDISDGGTYWYEVVSIDCEGLKTIRSNEVQLFINPEPQIISQPTNIRASLNEPALIKIDANYYYDGSYDQLFKWFRYDGIRGISIPLTENNKTQGTLSNILTIIPIEEKDYTYNGDYYYCEIYNLCDTSAGFVRSKPIFLLPGYNITITRDPESVQLCSDILPTNLTFRVYAYTSQDPTQIFYQWYEIDIITGDTVELMNGGDYLGVNTPTLTVIGVNMAEPDNPQGNSYYCKVWYYGDNPYDPTKYVVSDNANITFAYQLEPIEDIEEVNAYIGETAILNVGKDLNPTADFVIVSDVEWFYVEDGIYKKLPTPAMPLIFNINNISIYQAGTYVAIVTNVCNSVEKTFEVIVTPPPGPEVNPVIDNATIANVVDIQISPNPASNVVNIAFNAIQDAKYSAEITDLTGAVVYSLNGTTNANNSITLNADEHKLSSGSYIFNLYIDGKKTTKSFVIAR